MSLSSFYRPNLRPPRPPPATPHCVQVRRVYKRIEFGCSYFSSYIVYNKGAPCSPLPQFKHCLETAYKISIISTAFDLFFLETQKKKRYSIFKCSLFLSITLVRPFRSNFLFAVCSHPSKPFRHYSNVRIKFFRWILLNKTITTERMYESM